MPNFRLVTSLLVCSTLLLSACSTSSSTETSFRDDVLTAAHPLCGISAGDPCGDVRQITFRIFANSDVFAAALDSAENYIEGMMPSKIGGLFSQDATFGIIGLPFAMGSAASNSRSNELIVEIMYIANPEAMVEPMINLVISSETTLAVRQTVCDGVPGAEDLCLKELRELMEFYFTSDFSQ